MSTNVGCRTLTVTDNATTFPVFALYPTDEIPRTTSFGPYTMEVAPDAEPITGRPLVVISHGGGSTPYVLRTHGEDLAKRGYVVALPEHPGNNRNDNALEGTVVNLVNRPRHIRAVIDALAADTRLGARTESVAILGHSMGGYTALACAGAQPWVGLGQKIDVIHDSRVKALVLLAPATSFFVANDSLANVSAPILLYSAEHDRTTPRWQAQLVCDLVSSQEQVAFSLVENASHYSFLSPFPAAMRRPDFPPANDPPEFDREKFHKRLHKEIAAFLEGVFDVPEEPNPTPRASRPRQAKPSKSR